MKRPNVLLLYTDQQRWDTLGAVNPHAKTPNLDALAARGVLFEEAYCNDPVCMPSRQSMLSGRYPSVVGTTTNGTEMPPDLSTVYSVLQPHGYHAAQFGKLHFLNHSNRNHRDPHPRYGFDTIVISDEPGCYDDAYIAWVAERAPGEVENCRCSTPPAWTGPPVEKHPRGTQSPYAFAGPEELTHTAFVADLTSEFIRTHADETWFAIAGFYAPHAPVNPPQRFIDMFDPAEMPLPLMRDDQREKMGLSDDEWRNVRVCYHALVSHIDDQCGRILAALDEAGLTDDTIVIHTSDHGDHLGDHGIVAKGPPGFDSCAHVPLIVSWPAGIAGGERRTELVEAVDIAPTILDLCGVQIPRFCQGRSFRPLVEKEPRSEYEPRASAFIEFKDPFRVSWKTVRTAKYKYCAGVGAGASVWGGGGEEVTGRMKELLFDLENDPGELNDLSADAASAGALGEMRAEMVRRWFDVENQFPLRTGAY